MKCWCRFASIGCRIKLSGDVRLHVIMKSPYCMKGKINAKRQQTSSENVSADLTGPSTHNSSPPWAPSLSTYVEIVIEPVTEQSDEHSIVIHPVTEQSVEHSIVIEQVEHSDCGFSAQHKHANP
ncbi:Uncharacterized protein Fot_37025 [Forsythia ovata]|uniref:Uncharacterized protein n=1 Tax=Forsythia ovata TaxID=205694 RepID=A0ABD1SR33_9LAMI